MVQGVPVTASGKAADCHVHIFDPAYPFCPSPRYVPDASLRGTAEQFAALLDSHGFTHGLLVAAAPYGGDMRPVLDAIKRFNGRFKGIALVREHPVSDKQLQQWQEGGIAGVRFDLSSGSEEIRVAGTQRLLAQLRELNWFLEVHSIADDLVEVVPLLKQAGVRLMFDHVGRPDVTRGLDQPGFAAMLDLAETCDAVVKLSGPFRFSRAGYPYVDTDPFVAAAIDKFGVERCVWGSDWPFVNMGERVDFGPPATCLERWVPAAADRDRVLWDNPTRLFGFC